MYGKILLSSVEYNTSLAAPGALAHRLQRRTACKTQNGHQGAPKWPTGSEKGSNPRLLGISSHFCKISFLIRALWISTNQRPRNPKWPPGGPKWPKGLGKGV